MQCINRMDTQERWRLEETQMISIITRCRNRLEYTVQVLDAVKQMRKGFLVLGAQVEKSRVRREVERLLSQPVEGFVHRVLEAPIVTRAESWLIIDKTLADTVPPVNGAGPVPMVYSAMVRRVWSMESATVIVRADAS